jgi:hypothetical protein
MFVMDPIARIIYTALFLIIVGGLSYFGVRVYMLKHEIRELNTTIVELSQKIDLCNIESAKLNDSNTFLRQNVQRLNAYYRQKPKPPVVSGQTFNKDNLFMATPR